MSIAESINTETKLRHEALAARILRNSIPVTETGCWLWTGSYASRLPYGYMRIRCGRVGAHRVSFALFKGDLENGLEIHHKCETTQCVNPDHLSQLSPKENVYISKTNPTAINARKNFCSRGHELVGKNLRIRNRKRGQERVCVECLKRKH